LNVQVLDNPAAFTSPFQFQITFECVKQLVDGECTAGAVKLLAYYAFGNHTDIEWKVIYVGSASSDQYDQELDSVLVGPVPLGVSKFVLQVSTYQTRCCCASGSRTYKRRLFTNLY